MSEVDISPNKEVEIYFHYVIKAACLLFGERETKATLNKYLNAKWVFGTEEIPK